RIQPSPGGRRPAEPHLLRGGRCRLRTVRGAPGRPHAFYRCTAQAAEHPRAMGMTETALTPPVPITETHDLNQFACGEETLDRWLKERALKTEGSHSARTYVVCSGQTVVGYYCLATGAVVRATATKSLQRNMPDPIPVMVLGRLAIDHRF